MSTCSKGPAGISSVETAELNCRMQMCMHIIPSALAAAILSRATPPNLPSPVGGPPPDGQPSGRLARQRTGHIRRHQDQGGQRRKPGQAHVQADEPTWGDRHNQTHWALK